ncbi:IS3 family transposase [Alicyclobacillus tolerans]|uniref:IS3 family transposase n=1 Tax=Alicyclobacillus tolerans TaxID=90970 RepID=UPI0027DEDEDC|nr:IS3 family transposase [Alicyclobacillus tolerans]MCF8568628.1 IS3 family transposase [Alicyclobacillus tolerans]
MTAGYSVTFVLRIVGVSRSTYYFQQTHEPKPRTSSGGRPVTKYTLTKDGEKVSNEQVKEWLMEAIEGDGFAYGYLKLTYWLKRKYNLVINKKKVYRLCDELGVLKPQRKLKAKHPRRLARNRNVTGPNQLWEVDIKYGYVHGEDRFLYVLSYIDVFDRAIVNYHIGLRCEGKDAANTLEQALWKRKLYGGTQLPTIRSDNGPQFISEAFESTCQRLQLEHERIPPRTPNMNAHIESFHRLLEDDCLSRHEFESYTQAYGIIVEFMDYYNNRRMHSSLSFLSPVEFNKAHLETGLMPKSDVKV